MTAVQHSAVDVNNMLSENAPYEKLEKWVTENMKTPKRKLKATSKYDFAKVRKVPVA